MFFFNVEFLGKVYVLSCDLLLVVIINVCLFLYFKYKLIKEFEVKFFLGGVLSGWVYIMVINGKENWGVSYVGKVFFFKKVNLVWLRVVIFRECRVLILWYRWF